MTTAKPLSLHDHLSWKVLVLLRESQSRRSASCTSVAGVGAKSIFLTLVQQGHSCPFTVLSIHSVVCYKKAGKDFPWLFLYWPYLNYWEICALEKYSASRIATEITLTSAKDGLLLRYHFNSLYSEHTGCWEKCWKDILRSVPNMTNCLQCIKISFQKQTYHTSFPTHICFWILLWSYEYTNTLINILVEIQEGDSMIGHEKCN